MLLEAVRAAAGGADPAAAILAAVRAADGGQLCDSLWEVVEAAAAALDDGGPAAASSTASACALGAQLAVSAADAPRTLLSAVKATLSTASSPASLALLGQAAASLLHGATQPPAGALPAAARPLKAATFIDVLDSFASAAARLGSTAAPPDAVAALVAAAATLVVFTAGAVARQPGDSAAADDARLRLAAAQLLLLCARAAATSALVGGAPPAAGDDADGPRQAPASWPPLPVALAAACLRLLRRHCGVDPCALLHACIPVAHSAHLAATTDGGARTAGTSHSLETVIAQAAWAPITGAAPRATDGGDSDDGAAPQLQASGRAAQLRQAVSLLPFVTGLLPAGSGVAGDALSTALASLAAPSGAGAGTVLFTLAEVGATTADLMTLLSPLSPAARLRLALPQLAVVLESAAAAAVAEQQLGVDGEDFDDGDVDHDEILGVESRGARARAAVAARCRPGAAAVALADLAISSVSGELACLSAYPGASPSLLWVRHAPSSEEEVPPAGAPPPPQQPPVEVRLLQALCSLMVHAGGLRTRQAAHALLGRLLRAFHAGARFYVLSHMLAACPFPPVAAVLLDAARADVAAAASLHASPPPAGSPPSPFGSLRVHELLSGAVAARLTHGLTAPPGSASSAWAPASSRQQAAHLETWADADVALLSLLRLVLLLQARRQPSGAAPLLTRQQVDDVARCYARPLAAAVARCQADLREELHITALLPHPAPFVPVGRGGAAAGDATGRPAAPPAPPAGGADGALLSKLFLLDGALTPVLELLVGAA